MALVTPLAGFWRLDQGLEKATWFGLNVILSIYSRMKYAVFRYVCIMMGSS